MKLGRHPGPFEFSLWAAQRRSPETSRSKMTGSVWREPIYCHLPPPHKLDAIAHAFFEPEALSKLLSGSQFSDVVDGLSLDAATRESEVGKVILADLSASATAACPRKTARRAPQRRSSKFATKSRALFPGTTRRLKCCLITTPSMWRWKSWAG